MKKVIYLTLMIVLLYCSLSLHAQQKKVIIDCDPGVDDAVALVLALQSPTIEIVGITVTCADDNITQRTKNALRIVELSGKTIPVFQGALNPLVVPMLHVDHDVINGDDILGNTNQPEPKIFAQQQTAAQFIIESAKKYPGQITIVAQGRLTNLADAIRLDPTVTKNIKEVVVVGGAFQSAGLITPVAEPNIWFDPHAADMVFTSPWEVTILPLDITMKLVVSDSLLLSIKNTNSKYGSFMYSITRVTREFQMNALHADGLICIGAAGTLYLTDSTIFKYKKAPVRVVTEGLAIGQTIMPVYEFQFGQPAWMDKPLVSIALEVNTQQFLKNFAQIMKE